ncbi:MAG: hypothetical protein CL515_03650 [Actinobacteria bacterium]|nr:hypothetical protein [Actinomycetota bacterium]|tara:strand:+ start:1229 stop:1702 length:474 start_codon:yes stop_codon:yes gene_type:complete
MEPVSTALAGIALVQQSVEFIKKNINTVQDIRQIFDMVDNALDGQQQINKERWGNKTLIGSHKSAAHAVIDAKLANEQIEEMKNMIDMRFGFGTWQEILKLRADRIREEQEEEKRLARERRKKKAEIMETMQIIAIAGGGVLVVFAICFAVLSIWLR